MAFTNAGQTPQVYVLTNAGTLRCPAIDLVFGTPVQMCAMGAFLTTGSESAEIYQWNEANNNYDVIFNIPITDWYFWTSVTSVNGGSQPQGCLAAFGYSNAQVTQLRVDVYSMLSGDLFMSWIGPLNVEGQTMPTLSFHMNYLGVGSWGDVNGGVPQILLFDVTANTTSNVPIFTYNTPGSMFGIEIEVAGAPYPPLNVHSYNYTTTVPSPLFASDDVINLIAGGKHVHASEFGNGGDAFAFVIEVSTSRCC